MANAFKHKPGCKCCNGGSISVTANGCGGGFVAIDFTLSKTGQTSQSGTTREDGVPVVISGLATGNWTVSTTGSTPYGNRFIAQSDIFPTTVTAGATTSASVLCGVASGYVCLTCLNGTCPTCGGLACPYPLKTTLTCNDSFFGDAVTLTTSGTTQNWGGCVMRTVSASGGGTASVPFFYSFGRAGSGLCGATVRYPGNASVGQCGAGAGSQLATNLGLDPGTGLPVTLDCSKPQTDWPTCTNGSGASSTMADVISGAMPTGYCAFPLNIVISASGVYAPGVLGGGTTTLTITE